MADRPQTSVPSDKQRMKSSRPASPGPPDARPPPQKRARKAINCEPCRNSKLKCDRNRPCSSCVLRGTISSCYPDGGGHSLGSDVDYSPQSNISGSIDPIQEITRIRHSLSLLEASVKSASKGKNRGNNSKQEDINPDLGEGPSNGGPPGLLAPQGQGGTYTGPTSATSHLIFGDTNRIPDDASNSQGDEQESFQYDSDLVDRIPPIGITDALISHYFDYCNWIYRHVNERSFRQRWERFKSTGIGDRLTLATMFVIMAIAVHYLPEEHYLLASFNPTSRDQIGGQFYSYARTALGRHVQDSKTYSLELVELNLVRTHYMTLVKTDTEEIWQVTGELVTLGKAMGLHRDPKRWTMSRDVAERRRWAWWHIILLERWQSFMFGRPLAIASHHFDTELPKYCDPTIDETGRIYLPNLALFRLAYVLGDIVDQALSVRTVAYDSIKASDRALADWYDELPEELDLDDYRRARALASDDTATRRFGVQSIIIRASYYHIRFTLHRPYASAAHSSTSSMSKGSITDPVKCAQSLEIAVNAAEKLISMVSSSRPDLVANTSLAVPGHMNWGPFHCFSAAMFFSFQLLANPDQPGATLFRASIDKALVTLRQCRGSSVADKAFEILNALSPLYSCSFDKDDVESRESAKSHVLKTVRKLAFPYHDSYIYHRRSDTSSPHSVRASGSPQTSHSASPPINSNVQPTHSQYTPYPLHHVSSMRTTSDTHSQSLYCGGVDPTSSQLMQQPSLDSDQLLPIGGVGSSGSMNGQMSPTAGGPPSGAVATHLSVSLPSHASYPLQHHVYQDQPPSQFSSHGHDMWGASTGLEVGEWYQLMNVLQPHRQNVTAHHHHQLS